MVTKDELLRVGFGRTPLWKKVIWRSTSPSALRKALGDKSGLIATVPGRGYQFVAQVFRSEVESGIPVHDLPEQEAGDIVVQRVRERTRVVYEDVPAALPAWREPRIADGGDSFTP